MLAGLLAVHSVEAQTYNLKSVVIKGGGFVTGIIQHPNAAGVMYCRTDIGGAYRWNPTNDSWIQLLNVLGPANDEWSLAGIESIALDPQDANRLYMTCGWLGDNRPNAVMISTNQGASFTRVNAPFTMQANNDGRGNGERLAVDPNLGSILFNGTRLDGLWKSVNYGASFTKLPGIQNVSCVGLGWTASGSGYPVIYLAGQVNNTWGIFRSENQGTNWIRINDDQHQYGLISQITGDPRIADFLAGGSHGLAVAIANEQTHQRPRHELGQRARLDADQPDDSAVELNGRLGILPVGAALNCGREA